jgi:hypothetical protein
VPRWLSLSNLLKERRPHHHRNRRGRGIPALEHVPKKWTCFSDKDMLPKFLNWREFPSIR